MKIFSFILAIFVFSLITIPVLYSLDKAPESECCQDFCPAEEEQEDFMCNEMCNPFISCICAIGFIVPFTNNPLPSLSHISAKNSEYKQAVPIQYNHSIWHPPKA